MNYSLIAILLIIVFAIFLFIKTITTIWRKQYSQDAKKLNRRLNTFEKQTESSEQPAEVVSIVRETPNRSAVTWPILSELNWLLSHSGLQWSTNQFVFYSLLSIVLASVAAALLGLNIILNVMACVIFAAIPYQIVRTKSAHRNRQLQDQLPEALDLMLSMLRSGHTMNSSLALLAEELPAPLGSEFMILHSELVYGNDLERALMHMVERNRNEALRIFALSVLIQRETGGSLVTMLENIAHVSRENIKLIGRVRSLTAEGRMSRWILTFFPVAVGFVIKLESPDYISFFWLDSTGLKLLYLMIVMLIIGNLWIGKIINVRV